MHRLSRKPSACEKVVTEPEPLADRKRDRCRPRFRHQRHQHEFLAAEFGRECAPARVASTVTAASGGRPALARITGATNAWNVKIAEVGKPGSTTIGFPMGDRRGTAACRV